MPRDLSTLVIKTSKDGATTAPLGSLLLCLTVLSGKRFFLISILSVSCFSLPGQTKGPNSWVKSPLQGIVIPIALWALYHRPPIGAKGRAGHQLATCKFHLFLNIFFQGWEEDRTGRSTVLYTHTETISSCQQHFLICEKRSRKDKVNAGSLSEFIRHFAIHPNFISCFKFP